ncbi:hypothetical protein SERLADRAFT_469205 [Serpula lacrymans var. lacrymans S7.9]|uniref:Uncharacterized protein n=1 Tax=Serpula lacrymans var. lacrymans (strain S7.9) TaxID=578457 RepID=F8NZN2_SERL9|nr:uncharacterized protein SERLADRAFT_469205 [Serpula lacrymans var. lacrymans S7.9]EGO23363.1 hypothetical protein SERLADRAFT_469205 [Serpula lacrymans var. lacrymans S7.9]
MTVSRGESHPGLSFVGCNITASRDCHLLLLRGIAVAHLKNPLTSTGVTFEILGNGHRATYRVNIARGISFPVVAVKSALPWPPYHAGTVVSRNQRSCVGSCG